MDNPEEVYYNDLEEQYLNECSKFKIGDAVYFEQLVNNKYQMCVGIVVTRGVKTSIRNTSLGEYKFTAIVYDIYGKEHELFKKKEIVNNNTLLSKEGINKAINTFKDIDLDKVSNSLDSIKKVVTTIQEITKSDTITQDLPEYMKKSTFRRYND